MLDREDDKIAVAEIITARPGGGTSIGQQAMWHNNIDAINKIKALDPIAFTKAWAVPLDLKIQAQMTLAEPTPHDPKWVDKEQEANDILSKTKETVVDTVNEEHVTKATILAFFEVESLGLILKAAAEAAANKVLAEATAVAAAAQKAAVAAAENAAAADKALAVKVAAAEKAVAALASAEKAAESASAALAALAAAGSATEDDGQPDINHSPDKKAKK